MPGVDGGRDLVVEVVARQRGVVDLDVDLDLVLEPVLLEEGEHRRDVVVVLVLGRLHRLRLDEQRALEADRVLVLDHHVQEAAELIELAFHVGVEQRVVALASAPEDVVGATETVGGRQAVRDLGGRVLEHRRVGVGGGAGHEPRVRERVGRAPQQLGAACAPCGRRRRRSSRRGCGPIRRRWSPAGAMSVSWNEKNGAPSFSKNSNAAAIFNRAASIGSSAAAAPDAVARIPRPVERAGAEDVGAVPGEAVPVAHAEPEMLGHRSSRATTRSASYQRNASGLSESGPS